MVSHKNLDSVSLPPPANPVKVIPSQEIIYTSQKMSHTNQKIIYTSQKMSYTNKKIFYTPGFEFSGIGIR
jgi:hypothetical protein